ncbi:antibiotic biosynthesis monooxygenase [Pseudomonas sp. dw_358]|uniref:antibiotic biosynthesis monooxygenase n=1 Tax=Pseudomonas sp. dw_358 TaxID=2720083 RepID=UPI001BD3B314|nr:antibiotic biosynthesis monooxygenase [Pseudomonas sp. dw_358]
MPQRLAEEVVTLVIKHRIKAGAESRYEAWLKRTVNMAQGFPGHLGVDVIGGREAGLQTFTSVLRFGSVELLQHWMDSVERHELVAEATPMLADGDQTQMHPLNEFWFTPAADAQPPRWKQAFVTLCVILPLTSLLPIFYGPLFKAVPWLGGYMPSTVVVTLTIVLLVVYLLMPLATRLFAPWLQPRAAAAVLQVSPSISTAPKDLK